MYRDNLALAISYHIMIHVWTLNSLKITSLSASPKRDWLSRFQQKDSPVLYSGHSHNYCPSQFIFTRKNPYGSHHGFNSFQGHWIYRIQSRRSLDDREESRTVWRLWACTRRAPHVPAMLQVLLLSLIDPKFHKTRPGPLLCPSAPPKGGRRSFC